ncbi:MAG: zinc-binding dehydrogenase [Chloroflexi bacterium]|nr:zinc-binding dehydrogenase [Chloroflexota bacterium]
MKAVYINEQGDVDKLLYGDLPDPAPGPGEVLVRVRAAALNHLDIYARSGSARVRVGPFPHILGSDMAGEVSALGPGVQGLHVGERVVVDYVVKCGMCDSCLAGQDEFCRRPLDMGIHLPGGYAQYVKAPLANVHTIADSLSFEEAAAIPLVFHTAWHCLVTQVRLRPGETVLVNAAGGGVGSAAIQVARAMSARVLVTAGSDAKIARAKELGAEDGVNYAATPAFSQRIRELTQGDGVDVVFDSVGGSLWDESFNSLKVGGRLVNCGVVGGHRANLHLGLLFTRCITIVGSGGPVTLGSVGRSRREFVEFMRLVNRGILRAVVGRVFPLEQARDAHCLMESRDFFGKIVLRVP